MNIELPYLPDREEKPREKGVTMMMDKGLSMREVEDFIDSSGHLTDLVKFGFGTSIVTRNLADKVKLYQSANIRPYFGGTLFEAFVARGQFDEYRKFITKYGLDLAEVSDGSIILSTKKKCGFISDLAKDFTVLSEVGSKEEGILISPAKWIKMMQTELDAGSWMVIAEARESGNVGIYRPNGTAHTLLVNKILAKIPGERILWEAPIKAQQVWFIKLLGANVNLGNIDAKSVIPLETLRLGLRGDTFFEFLPDDVTRKLKQK